MESARNSGRYALKAVFALTDSGITQNQMDFVLRIMECRSDNK